MAASPSFQRKIRNFHKVLAPVMVLPLLLTAITGSLYQFFDVSGQEEEFRWLMALHTGRFGVLNLGKIYPFLNALGLIVLAITGISMWVQMKQRSRPSSQQ